MQATMIHGRYLPMIHAGYSEVGASSTLTEVIPTGNAYYVAKTGSDSSPTGSISQPYLTIGKGLSVLTAGATLYVRAGTYTENLDPDDGGTAIPGGTSWANPVTVSAYPGEAVTIKSLDPAQIMVIYVAGSSQQYIIINGFTIDGSNLSTSGGIGTCCVKVTTTSPGYVRVSNCTVMNSPAQGIQTTDGSDHCEFLNNVVHNNGGTDDFSHGFYISTANNIIQGNTCYSNGGRGIQVYHEASPGSCNGNSLIGNLCYGNGISSGKGPGISVGSGNGINLYNNICYGNNDDGIQIAYWSTTGTNVVNNTCVANGGYGIDIVGSDTASTLVENNITYNNGAGDYINSGTGTTLVTNLFSGSTNPGFVNAAGNNFQITSGSSAKGTGTYANAPATDYLGVTRANPPSKGAYEYPT